MLYEVAQKWKSLAYLDACIDAMNRANELSNRLDKNYSLTKLSGSDEALLRKMNQCRADARSMRNVLEDSLFSNDIEKICNVAMGAADLAMLDGHHHASKESFVDFINGHAHSVEVYSSVRLTVTVQRLNGSSDSSTVNLYGDVTRWPSQIKKTIYSQINSVDVQFFDPNGSVVVPGPDVETEARESFRTEEVKISVTGAMVRSEHYDYFINWAKENQCSALGYSGRAA